MTVTGGSLFRAAAAGAAQAKLSCHAFLSCGCMVSAACTHHIGLPDLLKAARAVLTSSHDTPDEHDAYSEIDIDALKALRGTNPQFDRQRFLDACLVRDKVSA